MDAEPGGSRCSGSKRQVRMKRPAAHKEDEPTSAKASKKRDEPTCSKASKKHHEPTSAMASKKHDEKTSGKASKKASSTALPAKPEKASKKASTKASSTALPPKHESAKSTAVKMTWKCIHSRAYHGAMRRGKSQGLPVDECKLLAATAVAAAKKATQDSA